MTFQVRNVPPEHRDVTVRCDGSQFVDWERSPDGATLTITSSVDQHDFEIATGYVGATGVDDVAGAGSAAAASSGQSAL